MTMSTLVECIIMALFAVSTTYAVAAILHEIGAPLLPSFFLAGAATGAITRWIVGTGR